ncbi:DnaJ family domain-containing protein [Pseudooceanicola sp. 502str34]
MSWLSRLTERRILKTLAEGGLSGLDGEGQPLPDRSGEAHLDAGEAMGYRIMAEAGALPDEIRWKKLAEAKRAELAGLSDPVARRAAMAELSHIQMQQAMAEEARRKFMRD